MPRNPKPWLDDDGCFLFGKHRGDRAEYVANHDPGYIRWVLDEGDCADEDRDILGALLRRSHPDA